MSHPKTLPISGSSTLQKFNSKIKKEAAQNINESPRYATLHSIDPSITSKPFADIIEALPRRQTPFLFQLRSGRAPLNKHLRRIAKSATATWSQCEERNESDHFLLSCPAYMRQCNILRAELGTKAHHMKYILDEPDCLKSLFKYITATRIFETVLGDVKLPKEINKQRI
jgi:hypothetical protein